jgi:hypothetical protein
MFLSVFPVNQVEFPSLVFHMTIAAIFQGVQSVVSGFIFNRTFDKLMTPQAIY